MKRYYVYILANKRNGTLYTGVNNNLLRRLIEHKRKLIKGFTEKYDVNKLVWYEQTNDVRIAIEKEKQIKKWNRQWKLELIEEKNPNWVDLFYEIGGTDEMLKPDFNIGVYDDE
jgi:putative endonuclease